MGHAEGICHVYVDEAADINTAVAITVDSKVDYPSGEKSPSEPNLYDMHCSL